MLDVSLVNNAINKFFIIQKIFLFKYFNQIRRTILFDKDFKSASLKKSLGRKVYSTRYKLELLSKNKRSTFRGRKEDH